MEPDFYKYCYTAPSHYGFKRMRRTEKRRTASFRELRLQEQLCPVSGCASCVFGLAPQNPLFK